MSGGNFFRASAEDFKKIPGSPVAYWVSERILNAFSALTPIAEIAATSTGMKTGDNNRFVRSWWEISDSDFTINCRSADESANGGVKWYPYNKGGDFRRWFGNNDCVINWENDGYEIKHPKEGETRHYQLVQREWMFREHLTWTKISSSISSFRLKDAGTLFDMAGASIIPQDADIYGLLAFCNSKIVTEVLKVVSSTLNFQSGDIAKLPYNKKFSEDENAEKLTLSCIALSRADWDSYETSWDFAANPLIATWNSEREKAGDSSGEAAIRDQASDGTLQGIYEKVRAGWAANCEEMRRLETENNRIFIEAYGLQDELTPEVPWHEITLTCNPWYRYGAECDAQGVELPRDGKLDERLRADTVKELISYAVGCMMGRYAIDKPGLVLANQGATYEDYLAQISEPAFVPDDDGIIPILEDDCFADDVVTQFQRFLRVTFGDRNFNANLSFIEGALGKDLRSYFVKDFYADHLQRYQKRPIYWLFSSPKGTFSALIYLHRYHPGTVGQVLGYLRSHITKIQSRVDAVDRTAADSAATQGMKTRAIKERAKLVRQLKELEDYERDVLHPLAGQRIEIDLDDGVKANYPKFGKALRKIPGLE